MDMDCFDFLSVGFSVPKSVIWSDCVARSVHIQFRPGRVPLLCHALQNFWFVLFLLVVAAADTR